MAASEETCEGNPNFAIICSFITKFGKDCGVNITIPDLQQMLEDTKNVNAEFQDLIIHLMRRGKKSVNSRDRWEKCLIKFCHEYSSVDAWELERFGFTKAKLSVKLEIFKRLLELQFDANTKFKGEVNKIDAASLRILPIGRDIDGQAYWYQLDQDYNVRLYREGFDGDDYWKLLCSTTDELRELLVKLQKKYSSSTDGDACEDKSDDFDGPKPPPNLLPVPKKERETEDLTSCSISSTKPNTIIIKTEKKEVPHPPDSKSDYTVTNIISAKQLPTPESGDDGRGSVKLKLKLETSDCGNGKRATFKIDDDGASKKSSVSFKEVVPMEVESEKVVDSNSVAPTKDIKRANDVEIANDAKAENVEKTNDVEMTNDTKAKNVEKTNDVEISNDTKAKNVEKINDVQMANNTKTDNVGKTNDVEMTNDVKIINNEMTNDVNKTNNEMTNDVKEDNVKATADVEMTNDVKMTTDVQVTNDVKTANDVEMTEVKSAPTENKSDSLNKELPYQSTSNSCSNLAVVDNSKPVNHKSSKIKLYEKWSSEKKKMDTVSDDKHLNSKTSIVTEKTDLITKNNPVVPEIMTSEQSPNPDFAEKLTLPDDNETAMDLSKSSRVNVIVQSGTSKPVLSNGVSSTAKSGDSEKSKTNSSSDCAGDISASEEHVKSSNVSKRNQDVSKRSDLPIMENEASSGSGFSHLQALQSMCETNSMGGIQSVIHTSKTSDVLQKNIAFSDINYEKMSKSYNFNEVHCSKDEVHTDEYETSNVLLRSNLHTSKKYPEEKDKESAHVSLLPSNSSTNLNVLLNESESSKKNCEKSFNVIAESSDKKQVCLASNDACNATVAKMDSHAVEKILASVSEKASIKSPNKNSELSNEKESCVKKTKSCDSSKREVAESNEISSNVCKEKIASERSETHDIKENKVILEQDMCQQKNYVKFDQNTDESDNAKCVSDDASCKELHLINVSNEENQNSLESKAEVHQTVPKNNLVEACSSNTHASEVIYESSKSVSSDKFENVSSASLKEHAKHPISPKSAPVLKSGENENKDASKHISDGGDVASVNTELCFRPEKQNDASECTKSNECKSTDKNKSTDNKELAIKEQHEANSSDLNKDIEMGEKCSDQDSIKSKADAKISELESAESEAKGDKKITEKCDDLKIEAITMKRSVVLKEIEDKMETQSDNLKEADKEKEICEGSKVKEVEMDKKSDSSKEIEDEKRKTQSDNLKDGDAEKETWDGSKVKEGEMEKKSDSSKESGEEKRKTHCTKESEHLVEKKCNDSEKSEDSEGKTHDVSKVSEDKMGKKSRKTKEMENIVKKVEKKSGNAKEIENIVEKVENKSGNANEIENIVKKSDDSKESADREVKKSYSANENEDKEIKPHEGAKEIEDEVEKEHDDSKESVDKNVNKIDCSKVKEDKTEEKSYSLNKSEDAEGKTNDDVEETKNKLEKKSSHLKESVDEKEKKCHSSKERVDEKGKMDDSSKEKIKIDKISEESENKTVMECDISKESDLDEHQNSGKEKITPEQIDNIEISKVTNVKISIKSRKTKKTKKQKFRKSVEKHEELSSNDTKVLDSNEDLDLKEKSLESKEKDTVHKIEPSDDVKDDSKDGKIASKRNSRKSNKIETQEQSDELLKLEKHDEKSIPLNDKIDISSKVIPDNLNSLKNSTDLSDNSKLLEPVEKPNALSDKLDDGHQVNTDTKSATENKCLPETSAKPKRKPRKCRSSRLKMLNLECKSQSDANMKETCDVHISDNVECSKSVLNSENITAHDHFKFYNLRHSLCIETKSKHPLCDLYVRKLPEAPQKNLITDLTFDISDDEPLIVYSNVAKMMKAQQNVKKPRATKNKRTQPTIPKAVPPAASPKKAPPSAKKRGVRNRKKENEKDDFIPEGFLEIIGSVEKEASEKEARGKRKKGSGKDALASQQSSESESNQRKRSRRIQEQHQKKMSELAVEMEKEQRMLEQMAKRSNANKKNTPQKSAPKTPQKTPITTPIKVAAKSPNVKPAPNATKTPNKGPKSKGKLEVPLLEEDTVMDSKRTTRKMHHRAKHLTKMTLMYEDESKDSQFSTSRETEKSKKRRKRHGRIKKSYKPWDLSSESSSSVEEITEEEEDPEEPLIFEVNEDEFACEEVDPDAEPVVVRRARTAKKTESEGATEPVVMDDKPCKKCGKYDKPEWILLCDKCDSGYHTHCLMPPLMIVPDGDWFCQPCEHMFLCQCLQEELIKLEGILKQREREALRKQRLAYVGISLDNVLKPDKKEEKSDESSKEETEKEEEKEDVKPPKPKEEHHSEDERHTKLYGKRSVRARRNVNYRFKEYDELIASAIQEEMIGGKLPIDDFKEEGDEENKSEAGSDKPFTARVPKRKRRSRSFRDLDDFTDEDDSGDEYQGGSSDSEATVPPSPNSEPESNPSDAEWGVTKTKGKSRRRRINKPKGRRRRRRGRGGSSYEEDEEEDWEGEGDNDIRPTTRRSAAQKAISYREISSDEEEWTAKPQQEKSLKRRKNSSSESEASFKKKAPKKKRIHKWASSDSEESEEKSMTSSEEESEEEEDEEKSGEESESEFKIKQKEKLRLKSNVKKVLSSDEEEDEKSSTSKAVVHKKKVISEDSEEEEEEESEEESEYDEESEEEDKPKKDISSEKKIDLVKKFVTSERSEDAANSEPKTETKGILSEKTKNAIEKNIDSSADENLDSKNTGFQSKVHVKNEVCPSPVEPNKQTITITAVGDKTSSKTVIRKETTKMVPCVIPYEKSPKSGRASSPEDESDEEIPNQREEMSNPALPNRPSNLIKKVPIHTPLPPSRIQFAGSSRPHGPHHLPVRPPVPKSSLPHRLMPPTMPVRPPTAPSNVLMRHSGPPGNLSVRPNPSSSIAVPPPSSNNAPPQPQSVKSKPESKAPYKSTIMEPFEDNDSDDEVPLERIPTACVPTPLPNRPVSYEKEAEYRPAAKELSTFSYAPPEEKSFPSTYSPLAPFQDYSTRPSPLKPSLVETYPNNAASPSKLTPLDTYSRSSSPKGFISLDSYSENRKKKLFGNPSSEAEPSSRPARPSSESYQGGEIRFPPEPYPCPQSPNSYRSPPPAPRDPGTPPRLYSQFPDAYAPPRSPEYYQNHQYYASEERIPRPSYQPNYAPPTDPPSFVSNPYVATPVPQPNGGFMIDTLLRARNHEGEEDELTGVTDIVSYITQE